MRVIECVLERQIFGDDFTLGELFVDGAHFAYTCEDVDRHLESGGVKIPGETAIPTGRYHLTVTMSNRFKKMMPQIMDVPQFSGVRIHGGNTSADTEGCPLIGKVRTIKGVQDCADVVAKLTSNIMEEEKLGSIFYITVR